MVRQDHTICKPALLHGSLECERAPGVGALGARIIAAAGPCLMPRAALVSHYQELTVLSCKRGLNHYVELAATRHPGLVLCMISIAPGLVYRHMVSGLPDRVRR